MAVLGQHDNAAATNLLNFIAFLFAVWLLTLAAYYPTIRYELGADELAIRFGPFIHWRLRYDSIRTVEKQSLLPAFRASTRMPGLALFRVHYNGVGMVRMCSTRTLRDIVLIDAESGRYGISPADEEQFLRELRRRILVRRAARPASG